MSADLILGVSKRMSTYGHRDGDVDANLAGLDLTLEASGGGTGTGKDGSTVSIFVLVNELKSIVGSLNVEANEDGPEDLLNVTSHVWFYISNDRWANLY